MDPHIQVKPLLFHPPLDLMPLNGRAYANVPPEMTEILRGASTLFWLDQKACANRLRQAIEGILDLGGVDECSNLYTRIETKITRPDLARLKKHLQSVRIIGNSGSHRDYDLRKKKPEGIFQSTQDDLIHAFQVIDVSLMLLFSHLNFDGKTKEIEERSSKK